MKRIMLVVQGIFALCFSGITLLLWFKMITEGDDAWFGWRRSFDLAGMYFPMYVFLLANVLVLPAAVVCGWSTLQRLGLLRDHAGVRFAANLLAGMSLTCLVVVGTYFDAWDLLTAGSVDSRPQPPSDASLEYPALPLAPAGQFTWTTKDLEGNALDVATLQGKTLFLNVWATWCGYCILEFPNIQRLRDAFKDDPNVVFLFVTEEPAEVVKAWRESSDGKDYDLPFYTTEEIPGRFPVRGYPSTFIVAPDGQTAFTHSGFVAWDGEKTQTFLKALSTGTPLPAEG